MYNQASFVPQKRITFYVFVGEPSYAGCITNTTRPSCEPGKLTETAMKAIRSLFSLAALASAALILSACGQRSDSAQAPGGMPPPEVSVVTVAPQSLALSTELPGRVEARRTAQVRARVSGIVLERVYREGSDVKAGAPLFRIDPLPYRVGLNSAQASVSRAEANLTQTSLKLQRYQPLVNTNAISKQEFDDVNAAQKQAAADLESAKAARDVARLHLSYATVTAPISGRIGRALVTEGALVGQGEATQLALIQQMDPVYVTLTQSSGELLKLQQAMAEGRLKKVGRDQAKVTLMLEGGQRYGQTGKLLFSDLAVDESSGAVTLRAEFPNPQRMLLPGMYVRAQLEQAVSENALVIPQQALQRDPAGATVMLVDAEGKVKVQSVKAEQALGSGWIVSEGLKTGDRVIVEGLQKVKPGAPVKPVPWQNTATPKANEAAKEPAKEPASEAASKAADKAAEKTTGKPDAKSAKP
jgi:membrane fusion protein, multidrug efflux system